MTQTVQSADQTAKKKPASRTKKAPAAQALRGTVPHQKAAAVKKTGKAASEKPAVAELSDLASEVLDDGYIDVMEDKTVALFVMGDMIFPTAPGYLEGSPDEDRETVIDELPEVEDLCRLEVPKVFKIKGAIPEPSEMLELSRAVQKELEKPGVAGVVVTQAPDAIEETAYFVSISLSDQFQNSNSKPIVFTSAMQKNGPYGDGARNLLDSIRVACHDVRGAVPTVVICMNNEIHAASRARVSNTFSTGALSSPGWGPVGYVDQDHVYFRAGVLESDTGLNFPTPKKLSAEVVLIKTFSGDDGALLEAAVKERPDGIVLEGFGAGNVPASLNSALKKALKKDILVVIATRADSGRVLDSEVFSGSVASSLEEGCLLAGETTSSKARLLLMYILSQKDAKDLKKEDPERFKAYVQECLDPVLADRLFR